MAWMHDLDAAQRHFDRALEISRALDDTVTTAWALIFKGYTMGYAMVRETDAAVAVAEEGLALFRALDYLPGIAQALNVLGILAFSRGDDVRARHAYEECLMVSRATGETRRIGLMFRNLAIVARHAGEYERAWELAERSLQIALEMNNKLGVAESLSELAGVLGMTGQPEQATRLLGAWEATLERMGASPDPCETREYDQTVSAIRARLDGPTFATAWTAGRAMSLEQAVALAQGCRES
jgi:tetratricopeptide (TPR) repeat protein